MNEEPPKEPSSTYTPSPEVPQELAPRLALILEVLSGAKTLAQAAREANLSRNHFQSLLNRSLGSMVQALTPQEPGRKPKPQQLSALQQRLKKLERENTRLKKRVEATDELIMVAGELLHGQRRPGQRTRRARKEGEPDDAEPEPRASILERVDRMRKVRPNTRTHRAARRRGSVDATPLAVRAVQATQAHRANIGCEPCRADRA